ncbi:ATP-binding cassette domain-containing protein [Nocardioides sp. zg-579]|uniref:ATP-binding cassette domain-containing protein n=1 Tax=Nocardioides marmotae TaxID=2663857 RepID=A0A6I3J8X3_9ACTN|nr:ABC transporter ATP-binding protein [Nocardioides marmotae]MCR6030109.1 ATP-binding cassette domain-containing protein [Gordonia jinghuaiqii]MTB93740.1 ATP-binding cassette domain-containing protein [Nocardioides marmotae]QKE03303.1 ABC transporter ATP-binding protein [Nocardioides marmotae]
MPTGAAAAPLLEVSNLRTVLPTGRGPVRAVDGVSFSVDEGETLGIVGESGSGKSVLMRTIMNLLPETVLIDEQSEIRFAGRDIRGMSPAEAKHFWGKEIAMVFQDPMTSLNPVKKVGTQLTESLRFHLGLSRKAAVERALELLNMVRIPEPRRRMDQYPHEMSGGMRQRVVIAIALACEPRLLIADEPTTALDVTVQRGVLDLLAEIQATRGMAMILITHDLGVVAGRANRVGVMYGGQLMELADTRTLFREVRHPYTAALLASIPDLNQPSHTRLATIEGRPPDMVNPPEGCRFAPRCQHVTDACTAGTPAFVSLGDRDRGVRCILPSALEGAPAHLPQPVLTEI